MQASPENLSRVVEDLIFSNSDPLSATVIVSIKLALEDWKHNIGVAFADASSKHLESRSLFPLSSLYFILLSLNLTNAVFQLSL